MRWIVAAVGVLIIVVGAGPAPAQQSLSEVAGSIKLKKPEGEQVVIDRATLGQSSRTTSKMSVSDALLETTGECAVAARTLVDLLDQTGGSMAFYDDDWRDRVAVAGEEMDQASNNQRMIVGQGRYETADETAERGCEMAEAGLETLRDAIAADRPVFSEAKRQMIEGIRLLESAQTDIRAVMRQEDLEADSPLMNPIAADQSIRLLCGRRFAQETDGYAGCVDDQKAAVSALGGRYAPAVGLESAEFNVVRNNCRFEWPDDFVNRDRCERQRIAAITR